jgi:hypothetical protein
MGRTREGDFTLMFRVLDKNAEKGQRVRVTKLKLSPDAMDAVVNLYFHYSEKGLT